MAWLIDAATDKVLVPSGWSGGVATVVMWIKRSNTTTSHGNNPFRAWSSAAGSGSTLAGLDAQGSSRNTLVSYDSAFSNITGGAMGDALWHCVALSMNGTAWAIYYGTDPNVPLTKVTGTKAATGTVGSWTLSDSSPDWFDGTIHGVKVFSRALSDAEVAAELATSAQVSATNLIFRGTLNTTSTTPETGTAMTAGGTGVTAVPGPALPTPSVTTIAASAAGLVLPPAPLAAYGFTGAGTTVTDDSGNGNDWSLSGGATLTASGKTGQGLTTDGTGVTSTVASPAFGQSANRTVMLWMINPANTTQWVLRWNVVSIGSGSWGILLLNTQVVVQARNAGGLQRAAATRPTDGLWHHYAATYDGTNVRFYLDGTLTDTQALSSPLRTDADTIDIGEWTDTSTVVDDLRLYDSALSAAQIAYLSAIPVTTAASTGGGTSATTVAASAAARAVGVASSASTISASAAARALGAGSSATTIAASAAARGVGAGAPITTISATATARALATASSGTTISASAAGAATGAIGAGSSATTISASAAGRLIGFASSVTTVSATATASGTVGAASVSVLGAVAAARDLTPPAIPGGPHAGAMTMSPTRRGAGLVMAGGLAGAR
jgi:hypothetical protein